jgi:DNA-binding HxlR family transcriptional regulator
VRDAVGGPESTGSGDSDSAPNLRELVSHPHVIEVLDALSHGPRTVADIRSIVRAGRRRLAVALRIIAARGLVIKDDDGSWDTNAPGNTVYRQTARGRQIVEALSHFSVWTAMFDGSDTVRARATVVPKRATTRVLSSPHNRKTS